MCQTLFLGGSSKITRLLSRFEKNEEMSHTIQLTVSGRGNGKCKDSKLEALLGVLVTES